MAFDSAQDGACVAALGVSERLRHETSPAHREAERSGFLADLIRGRATPAGYALYLRNLVPVYGALEAGLRAGGAEPYLAPFREPGLARLPSLTADLAAASGAEWATELPILPEARRYALAIETSDDIALAAHAYTRYLGDLNGGRILRGLLSRSLGLPDRALAFYAFPDLADVETTKQSVRRGFDRLDVRGRAADDLIDAARRAFRFNIDLSCAVARHIAKTTEAVGRDQLSP